MEKHELRNIKEAQNMQEAREQTDKSSEVKKSVINNKEYLIPESWNVKNIEQTSILKGRIGWQGLTTAEYRKNGDYILITGTDFKEGGIDWESCFSVSKKRYMQDKNIQVQKDDILITKDGTIGKVAYINSLPKSATLNSGVFVVRPINRAYLPSYLYFVFSSPIFEYFIENLKAGSTISHLYQKDLVHFEFPLPNKEQEQNKISAILKSADNLIQKTKNLIEKHKRIKQGLMHDLFLKGIAKDGKPHETFKESKVGPIPKEWTLSSINSITDKVYRYPTYYNIEYIEKGVKEIRGELIEEDGSISHDSTLQRQISERTNARFPKTILQEGDLVISVRGTIGKIGYIDKQAEGSNITANLIRISPNRKKIYPKWLKQYFLSDFFQSALNFLSSATTIKTIKSGELKAIKVSLPKRDEQQRISEILDAIDKRILVEQVFLDKLLKMRDGLMVDLLTGKVRVAT